MSKVIQFMFKKTYMYYFLMKRKPTRATLFPYTTLFRSTRRRDCLHQTPIEAQPPPGRRCEVSSNHVGRQHWGGRSEEHTSELQSQSNLVCRLLLEKKKIKFLFKNNKNNHSAGNGNLRRA